MRRCSAWIGGLLLAVLGLVPAGAAQTVASTDRGTAAARTMSRLQGTQERFELLDIDTLFYLENEGLTRLLLNLNGHPFKLVTDPPEVQRSSNAFLVPQFGAITVNIAAYITPGDGNYIDIVSQGPVGSDAFILIGDLLVPGQRVAYAIEALIDLPARFDLLKSYPNPFRDRVTITYEVPEQHTSGVPVSLALYDVMGRRVRLFVDDHRFPGRFSVTWDLADDPGAALPGGLYFCHLVAGTARRTIQLVRVR